MAKAHFNIAVKFLFVNNDNAIGKTCSECSDMIWLSGKEIIILLSIPRCKWNHCDPPAYFCQSCADALETELEEGGDDGRAT